MKNLLINAVLSFVVTAASGAAMAAGDAAAGKDKVTACAACHGSDGNSAAPTFPKLAEQGEKYIYKQLHDIKSGLRVIPEMLGQLDNLSDQDMADIAAYFSSNTMQLSGSKKLQVKVNSGLEVDALALGEKLYRAGNPETRTPACMGCHSPTGQGNAPAGFPRLAGQYPEYLEKQLRAFRSGNRVNDGDNKIMRGVTSTMSDAEIISVANYIAGLQDPKAQ